MTGSIIATLMDSPAYLILFLGVYLAFGRLVWFKYIAQWQKEDGPSCHFVQSETKGFRAPVGVSLKLMLVQLAFSLLWMPFVLLETVCLAIGVVRFRLLASA